MHECREDGKRQEVINSAFERDERLSARIINRRTVDNDVWNLQLERKSGSMDVFVGNGISIIGPGDKSSFRRF